MIKSFILFLIFSLITSIAVFAQDGVVSGKLINVQDGLPIEGATVSVVKDGHTTYQTLSDSLGFFRVPSRFYMQMNFIKITGINYEYLKIEKKAADNNSKPVTDLGIFKLTPIEIKLKEVKVKSTKRYSDTSKIDLSKEKFDRSVMVDDIFSKYGFSKGADGSLYYKGKPVANVTVNGEDFFGSNNMDVYKLLPALVLNDIDVIETNIDSLTNTTQLRPSVKVNLKFKAQYNKGLFGNANLGGGTLDRYLANTNLFTYANKQQISLVLGTNNINAGDNFIEPPSVSFSVGGNDVITDNAKFTYRNFFANKLEVNLLVNGKATDKVFNSEYDRDDFDLHQLSKTTSSSKLKEYKITDANLVVNYTIDPYNLLTFTQDLTFDRSNLTDSSNYSVTTDSSATMSKLSQVSNITNTHAVSKINYSKRFASKKGRILNVAATFDQTDEHTAENDNIYSLNNNVVNSYYIHENIFGDESIFSLNTAYNEPLNLNSLLTVSATYKNDRMGYNNNVNSDTLINFLTPPATIINRSFTTGARLQYTFDKMEFTGNFSAIYYSKDVLYGQIGQSLFFKVNGELNADFKLNPKDDLLLNYTARTNFPDLNQLSSVGATFNLVSETTGNLELKPEDKQSLNALYSIKTSATEAMSFGAQVDYYSDKFGYSLSNVSTPPVMLQANVGDAKDGTLTFNLTKNIFGKYFFNSNSSIGYIEQPSIVNNQYLLNNGITLNQSMSTNITLLNTKLVISPLLNAAFSRFFYAGGDADVINAIVSGKVSLNTVPIQVAVYPLFNYSYSVIHNTSFSMNAEAKKSFFKNTLDVWVHGYDLLNSFKFFSTYVGPTYTESIRYSTLERYVFLGLSYKFNNLR